jgi:hypothetical protein
MSIRNKITHLTKDIIRASAIKELTWRGYTVWVHNNLAVRGRKFIGRRGVPDIIGITKDGRWVVAEVKTLNDVLSPDQIIFLNDIRKAGGEAYLAVQEGSNVRLKVWEVKQ